MNNTLTPTLANMVLDNDGLENTFEYETQPSLTYKLNSESKRVAGYTDGLEAYKQAIYKIINTERYEFLIYSWNYGVELKPLFGQPIHFVVPEIERRLTEAIMQDDRSESVGNFEFDTTKRGVVHVKFTAKSIYGDVTFEKEIEV